jgi:NitT/TauT family transport system substrate-binding protein
MKNQSWKILLVAILTSMTLLNCSQPKTGENTQPTFTVQWGVFAGSGPWDYAEHSGILQRRSNQFGVKIKLERVEAAAILENLAAGKTAGGVVTNMEALDTLAAGGIDTTIIIIGDTSNGCDQILTRKRLRLKDLKGVEIHLIRNTVSEYLLAKALETVGLSEKDVKLRDASDAEIESNFLADKRQLAVVTWDPMVSNILDQSGGTVQSVFSSAQIPRHIQDVLVLRTDVVRQNPNVAKALVAAWYDAMAVMSGTTPEAPKALEYMAESSGTNLESFRRQLKTIEMFYTPEEALSFADSKQLIATNESVREFCFQHGLLVGVASKDAIGIEYPDGSVRGDKNNVKLRFNNSFVRQAALGMPPP